ncbi:hypothetical protein AALA52_06990 [Lactococcus ileimucosae]|uniref:Flagellin n=1 Tax=Lactococcus ileimucosae TaxID=2941329 RepID=A0ABV4D350_9LACT
MIISSDEQAANQAISGVNQVNLSGKTTINFSKSNIAGMKAGKTVANTVLGDLDNLVGAVKKQASKFKELAAVRASLDASDKNMFR